MAIFKRCNHCHRLYEGKNCPECTAKMNTAYQRKRLKENEGLKKYHTRVWGRCRRTIIMKYLGYDIWLLSMGIWEKCNPAYIHHIQERDKRPDLFLDEDNLIPVSHASHEEIHAWYNSGREEEAIKRIEQGKEVFRKRFNDEY